MINEKSELLFCLDSNESLMNAANMTSNLSIFRAE